MQLNRFKVKAANAQRKIKKHTEELDTLSARRSSSISNSADTPRSVESEDIDLHTPRD